MTKIEDTNGNKYTGYGGLTDAMLQYCDNAEADNVAAGFGHSRTHDLLEFAEQGFDQDSGLFDLAKGAGAFDAWLAF